VYYDDTYASRLPYTGQSIVWDGRCPICAAEGECPDAVNVAMPFPPFDLGDEHTEAGGPLRLYAVTVNGATGDMRLNDADAARYGDAAVPIP
jgi:hypothetical protein